jgi:hypothetical protein
MTVDDDDAGGTSGNGDGLIDGGETVDLGITVRNTGGAATAGVVDAVLRTSDFGVTLVDSTADGVALDPSESVLLTAGVRVAFADTLVDEHAVPFTLVLKDDGVETWQDTFKKDVHQPQTARVRLRIQDTGTGNGDGVVDAGEQFKLFYEMKNYGTGAFPGGGAVLFDVDGAFTFIDSTDA